MVAGQKIKVLPLSSQSPDFNFKSVLGGPRSRYKCLQSYTLQKRAVILSAVILASRGFIIAGVQKILKLPY